MSKLILPRRLRQGISGPQTQRGFIINPYAYAAGGGGSFPALLDITLSTLGSANTVHAVSYPASVTAGDLLMLYFHCDGGGTISTPAGWTSRSNIANGASATRSAVFTRTAVGTETGTFNVTISGSGTAMAYVVRIQTGTFGAGIGAAQKTFTNSSSTVATSALTASWGAANTLWLQFGGSYQSGISITTYPYPNNNRMDDNGQITAFMCTKQQNIATQPAANFVFGAGTYGQLHTIGVQPI